MKIRMCDLDTSLTKGSSALDDSDWVFTIGNSLPPTKGGRSQNNDARRHKRLSPQRGIAVLARSVLSGTPNRLTV